MNLYSGSISLLPYTSVTAIIPARAGSKGLPNKNILELGGISLIEHSILLSLNLPSLDFTVVTTDIPESLRLLIYIS